MSEHFTFLPNVRTRLAADGVKDTESNRLKLEYGLKITANGVDTTPAITTVAHLKGPGDVVAINNSQIAKIEPNRGLRGFEPNYFPFIEFIDADFPWRYSLDENSGNRCKPWLSLIALKPDEFEFVDQGIAPLPRIRVLNAHDSLPQLSHSWATAHCQVNLSGDAEDPVTSLNQDASKGFSRLMCFRKLEPNTAYYLFLVPAYQAGVFAGLGKSEEGAKDEPAWDHSAMSLVELPFYFQSRFNTNAQEDVENLLRRLKAYRSNSNDEAGAAITISAAQPGYYTGYENPGATFRKQAALKQPGVTSTGLDTAPALMTKMKQTLDEYIAGEVEDDNGDDPLVSLPAYGFRFRQETSVEIQKAKNKRWFDRINLDLKMRQAAAVGNEIVRKNQEDLMKLCWSQYEDIIEANRRLASLELARELSEHLVNKHLRKLSSDVVVALAEPIHPFLIGESGESVSTRFHDNGVPTSYAGRGVRRLAAKRPVKSNQNARMAGKAIPTPQIPGDKTPGSVSVVKPDWSSIGKIRRDSELSEKGLPADIRNKFVSLLGEDSIKRSIRPRSLNIKVASFKSTDIADEILSAMKWLPVAKADFIIDGLSDVEKENIKPVYRSPDIPLPLVNYLKRSAKDSLLSGAEKMPDNTVSIFEENRDFIEAFMVGANHAINDELRWREFPADLRGTVFRYFWDKIDNDGLTNSDIKPIHEWNKTLGNNTPDENSIRNGVVVAIRGDIVRKLRMPIVVINEAHTTKWSKDDDSPQYEPSYSGTIGNDIIYYGFDISRQQLLDPAREDKNFFVIYEPMGQLRFGLDVATVEVRKMRLNYDRLPLSFPIKALNRSYSQIPLRPSHNLATVSIPPAPTSWDELSWNHLGVDEHTNYLNFEKNILIAGADNLWGADKTSASIARALWQKPVAAVIPTKRIL